MANKFTAACLLLALPLGSGCSDWVRFDPRDASGGAVADAASLTQELTFDHSALSNVLSAYVSVNGSQAGLDYNALLNDSASLAALDGYRLAVGNANPSALGTREERLAFWMNAYNANVISGVVNKLFADPGFRTDASGFVFFAETIHLAGGFLLSLDEIEHGVIRGDFDHPNVIGSASLAQLQAWHAELMWPGGVIDPRIHMAVNCGARSCPNLQTTAWAPATLDADLEAALVVFLADPTKGAGPQGISTLFSWFREDWIAAEGSATAYITNHRQGGLGDVAVGSCGNDDTGAGCLTYDWSLNVP